MKQAINILFLLSLLICSTRVFSQNAERVIQSIVQEMTEEEVSEATIEEVSNTLWYWAQNKMNINTTDLETLVQYRLINPMQGADIFDYKKKVEQIYSPYELLYMESFTQEDILRLMSFVNIDITKKEQSTLGQIKYGKHEVLAQTNRTTEKKEGYKNQAYEGVPTKVYGRYKYQSGNHFSTGITVEKDPGESFFSGSNPYGFDHISAHGYLESERLLNKIAVGDYKVTMGQGLIAGQSVWGSKGKSSINIRNTRQGFKPYKGATEYGFMRGAAIEKEYKQLKTGLFVSSQKTDATIEGQYETITSLSNTGLHRTETEIERENNIKTFTAGGYFGFRTKSAKIYFNSIVKKYNKYVEPSTALYDLYDFTGKQFINNSLSVFWQRGRLSIFGEVALDKKGNTATICGATLYPSGRFGLALLYRNYPKSFLAPLGNAFGENSAVQNENGYYLGIEWLPFKKTKLNLYADFFSFPWLRYNESSPTDGMEYLLNLDYDPKNSISMDCRVKYETKTVNQKNATFPKLLDKHLVKARYSIDLSFNKFQRGQARIAYSWFSKDTTNAKGLLLYYEHFWKPENEKFEVSIRFALFDVEDYNARIYAYEQDVLYSFSIPSFQGTGTRAYINLKWSPHENIDIYARIDRTNYLYQNSISSGNEEINQPHKTGIHLKLKWAFF